LGYLFGMARCASNSHRSEQSERDTSSCSAAQFWKSSLLPEQASENREQSDRLLAVVTRAKEQSIYNHHQYPYTMVMGIIKKIIKLAIKSEMHRK